MAGRQSVQWSNIYFSLNPTGSSTYKQCPRKYCRQSRHGKGLSARPRLPGCLASPSDAPHPHTQRTSCGREGWEGKIVKRGVQAAFLKIATILLFTLLSSASVPPQHSLCWSQTHQDSVINCGDRKWLSICYKSYFKKARCHSGRRFKVPLARKNSNKK